MRKLIKPHKGITIDDIVEMIQMGKNIIIFYRSRNLKDGTPSFFKYHKNAAYFFSPIVNRGESYIAKTIRESIELCSRSRDIYVLLDNEYHKLFKLQNEITIES